MVGQPLPLELAHELWRDACVRAAGLLEEACVARDDRADARWALYQAAVETECAAFEEYLLSQRHNIAAQAASMLTRPYLLLEERIKELEATRARAVGNG